MIWVGRTDGRPANNCTSYDQTATAADEVSEAHVADTGVIYGTS